MTKWWEDDKWAQPPAMNYSRRVSGAIVRVRGEFHTDGTPIRLHTTKVMSVGYGRGNA